LVRGQPINNYGGKYKYGRLCSIFDEPLQWRKWEKIGAMTIIVSRDTWKSQKNSLKQAHYDGSF